jgi:hypothetical protein
MRISPNRLKIPPTLLLDVDEHMNVAQVDLPFRGGVGASGMGASGMGAYHGFDGFRNFCRPKAVFE